MTSSRPVRRDDKLDIFGSYSLSDIEGAARRKLRRRATCRNPEMADDAMGVGMLALYSYWVPRYAGRYETQKAFDLAVEFVFHRALESLIHSIQVRDREVALDAVGDHFDAYDPNAYNLAERLADSSPTPEEELCSPEHAVSEMWRSLPASVRVNYYGAVVGESVRAEAARRGVSPMKCSVNRRRAAAFLLLCRKKANSYGL